MTTQASGVRQGQLPPAQPPGGPGTGPSLQLPALEQEVLGRWAAREVARRVADRMRTGTAGRPMCAGPRRSGRGGPRLPRPAGRGGGGAGARPFWDGGHRGLRSRTIRGPLPRIGRPAWRSLLGAQQPPRLPQRRRGRPPDDGRQLHRVGVAVGAADLRRRAARAQSSGNALLPALSDTVVGA